LTSKLRVLLLESPLELIPDEIRDHPQVVRYARRFDVDPSEVLLDKTYHYYAMARLDEKWKRGRPDIVHVVLLLLQDSILNMKGLLEVYIHVRDGRVFYVEPGTRVPKHLDRFKGLMAQLLIHDRVPPVGDRPLIYKVFDSLEEAVKEFGGMILLWERGKHVHVNDVVREAMETGWPIGIGMFPRGDFSRDVLRLAKRKYSLYGGTPLKAWTVVYKLLCAAEANVDLA
jgi:rRNA small subunit pseudouridine methyltransferase Nep1